MVRACSTNGKDDCISVIRRKARRKETTGKTRRRWVDNIKMDLKELRWDDIDWIHLAQDREQWNALVKTVTNLRVP
jgi:hypothetical protein